MIRHLQIHPGTALAAYLFGLIFGVATIASLVPAVTALLRAMI